MLALVYEVDDAECRLTHVRVMMSEVLTSCICRLEIISPYRAEELICPRPDCLCVTVRIGPLAVIFTRGRLPLTESANSSTTPLCPPIVIIR